MDLASIAKIVEISPLIGLTAIFSFVVYKMGISYIKLINRILEEQTNSFQNLRNDITGHFIDNSQAIKEQKNEHCKKMENIAQKIDKLHETVTKEFDYEHTNRGTVKDIIVSKIDDLRMEVFKLQATPRGGEK